MTNAGVVDLVGATVDAGAPVGEARNWWMGYLAQKANEPEIDAAELAIRPGQVARVIELVADGSLSTRAGPPGRRRRARDRARRRRGHRRARAEGRVGHRRARAGGRRRDRGQPRRRREGAWRQGGGRRGAGRRGHEGDARAGRRGRGEGDPAANGSASSESGRLGRPRRAGHRAPLPRDGRCGLHGDLAELRANLLGVADDAAMLARSTPCPAEAPAQPAAGGGALSRRPGRRRTPSSEPSSWTGGTRSRRSMLRPAHPDQRGRAGARRCCRRSRSCPSHSRCSRSARRPGCACTRTATPTATTSVRCSGRRRLVLQCATRGPVPLPTALPLVRLAGRARSQPDRHRATSRTCAGWNR